MTQRLRWLAISVVLALTLAACNGSSADTLAAGRNNPQRTVMGIRRYAGVLVDEVDGPLNFYNGPLSTPTCHRLRGQYDVDVVETFDPTRRDRPVQAGVVS